MGDNGPGPSRGQLPGTKAARVTGLLMLVPERRSLEGGQAAGSQALEPWDGGWEEKPVGALADWISESSRRLGTGWGRGTGCWDGGDDEHCLGLLLSLLEWGRVLRLPAFWFKKKSGVSIVLAALPGECLGVLTVIVKKMMSALVFRDVEVSG